MRKSLIFITLSVFYLLLIGCKKDNLFTKDQPSFSVDTLLFDTIFTTVGSTTKKFKVYNPHNVKMLISEIELMGGESSPFRINVDGLPGDYHSDITLPAKDSIFIFVEVTLQVNNATNPLVISDSVRFKVNGQNQYVYLDVWGQDAYFHANEIVSGIWPNDKPHVIYGIAAVGYPGIDSNLNLTIQQGTDIYCHKNSFLYVYKSSLNIEGELNNEVTFQGDRLESFYDEVSGQWGGIILNKSNACSINYAIIKNSAYGLQCDETNVAGVTLFVSNTIIDNTDFFGFFAGNGCHVVAENSIFGKAGLMSVFLFAGGTAEFYHCNFVNYWQGGRGGPAFGIKNYWEEDNVIYTSDVICDIHNSVFYGNQEDEFIVDTLFDSPAMFDIDVTYCLIKRGSGIYDYPYLQNIIWNLNPDFNDPNNDDFTFEENSPLNGGASSMNATTYDISGVIRSLTTPDIGAYEKN